MPATTPVQSVTEPSRAAGRAGSARPSEAGFSGQLAEALAAPAPGGAPVAAPQPVAGQGEPTLPSVIAQAEQAPAIPAPAPEPATPPTQLPDAASAGEAVVAAESEPVAPASEREEPAADQGETEAPPSGLVPVPAAVPSTARQDAGLAPPVPAEAPGAGAGQHPAADAPASDPDPFSPAMPGAQLVDPDAGTASGPETGESAAGERDPSWSVADSGQAAPPPAAPPPASSASDAASLSSIQPNAPAAQAARPAAAPADAAPAPPPPPAAQVAPAVVALVSTAPNGLQRLVVRLDPVELGQVEVRVERTEGGPATVALTAERPETLLLLVRDQAGLHRALDQAGIPAEGRTLQFQLGPQGSDTPGQPPDLGAGGGWGGFGGQGARHGRGETNRAWRQPGGETAQNDRAAWRNAGIDITA